MCHAGKAMMAEEVTAVEAEVEDSSAPAEAVETTEVQAEEAPAEQKLELSDKAFSEFGLGEALCASLKEQGSPAFPISGIQPTIPEGKRLLGLGTIKGTPILADSYNGQPTCYKTASGEVHDTRKLMGPDVGLSFSDGVFADAEGQQYHGFVCNPPPLLADAGALQIQVYRRVGDPSGLPAIVSVGLDPDTEGGPPAAEEVAFD